jgi:hypothetical protein
MQHEALQEVGFLDSVKPDVEFQAELLKLLEAIRNYARIFSYLQALEG